MKNSNRNLLDCWYEGKHPILNISEAGFHGSKIVEELVSEYTPVPQRYLEYESSQGSEALINELVKRYHCKPQNVLITNGTSEALFLLLMALCKPLAKVTCQFPYYATNLDYICHKIGASLCFNDFFSPTFQFDFSSFCAVAIKNKSDIIILNFPNNPTATEISCDDYDKITRAIEKNQVVIFDEATYLSELPSFLEQHISDFFPQLITINGMSKAFGLPGLRVGWIIADEMVIKSCQIIKESLSICTVPNVQDLAAFMLSNSKSILSCHRGIVGDNWRNLSDIIASKHLPFETVRPPRNSAFCLLKLIGDISDFQYCSEIYHKLGVLVTPGSCFNLAGFCRIGLGISSDKFLSAMDMLSNYHNS